MPTCFHQPLVNLKTVVADCQTTGPTPERGHLLELSYGTVSVSNPEIVDIKSHLLQLPNGAPIPARIQKITGIQKNVSQVGEPLAAVREAFLSELRGVETGEVCVVAHYARFEQRFLSHLLSGGDSDGPDLTFICTYELARRLLPDLPKHTLRAVSGALGHHLPEKKRAFDHVRATIQIWLTLVQQLREQEGITRMADVLTRMTEPPPKRPRQKRYFVPQNERAALPSAPGVYRFLDSAGAALYVGKATNLKQRVSSYFTHARGKSAHILEMLACAHHLTFEPTQTALEAALLETETIQVLNPPYNRALRIEDPDLFYFRPNLDETSPHRSNVFPIGPFPNRAPIAWLKSLHALLNETAQDTDIAALIEPVRDCLPVDTLIHGAQLFRHLSTDHTEKEVPISRLIALGQVLNQRDPPDEASSAERDDPSPSPDTNEDRTWDGERVVRFCCRIVSGAATYWQRARWYGWLGSAAIQWQVADGKGIRYRTMGLSACRIVSTRDAERIVPNESQGAPTHADPPQNRAAYDRMRILTTELRRLLAANRPIRVTIGSMSFDGARLRKLLAGV